MLRLRRYLSSAAYAAIIYPNEIGDSVINGIMVSLWLEREVSAGTLRQTINDVVLFLCVILVGRKVGAALPETRKQVHGDYCLREDTRF